MIQQMDINIPGFQGTVAIMEIGQVYCPGDIKVSPSMVRSIQHTGAQSLITVRKPTLEERCRWEQEGLGAAAYDYVVIAGRRRYRAFEQLQYPEIAVLIRNVDHEGEQETLVENLVRDKNLMAEFEAYEGLIAQNVSEDEMQKELGVFKRDLNKLHRLLDMAEATRKALRQGTIAPSTAVTLAKLPEDEQARFFEEAHKYTLTAAREWVRLYRLPSSQLEFLTQPLPSPV